MAYLGSANLQTTTTTNTECIPNAPSNWTFPRYYFKKFTFVNPSQACHVSINGGTPIYLAANQGFSTDKDDDLINSFIIQESGISFNWMGEY